MPALILRGLMDERMDELVDEDGQGYSQNALGRPSGVHGKKWWKKDGRPPVDGWTNCGRGKLLWLLAFAGRAGSESFADDKARELMCKTKFDFELDYRRSFGK